MNRRSAASSRSGFRRWRVPTFARTRCVVNYRTRRWLCRLPKSWFAAVAFCVLATCVWIVGAQVDLVAALAAEPAPLPPLAQEDPLQFRPRMRQSLGNPPVLSGETVVPEPLPVEPPIRGLAPGGNEAAEPMPGVAFSPECPPFFRGPRQRYAGPGQPLIQESWSFRPFSLAGVFGFVQGSPLIDDWIRENQGVLGGVQLGWDCEHYWGFETRFAWAKVEVTDSDRAIAAQQANDDAAGLAPDDRFRHRFDGRRYNDLFIWDAHALFYPWGDSAWRPYLMVGVGATAMSFIDRTDVSYKDTLFTVPVGLGVKYRLSDFLAARVEAADFMAFGGGQTLELIHNVTVTGAIEFRFGGPRRAYWPWNPGRHYW